jgi:hypothetical protein
MITEVVMKRELFGCEISQKSKSEFFSATELVKAGNIWRSKNNLPLFDAKKWYQLESTKEFIKELEKRFGKVKTEAHGRGHHTWVHPFLFIDLALAISPTLKIEVYTWLYDYLLKYRNDSGDSYKRMAGALYIAVGHKVTYPKLIKEVAAKIKNELRVDDWQKATEKELEMRDKIHDNIALLVDIIPIDDAVRIAIKKVKSNYNREIQQ